MMLIHDQSQWLRVPIVAGRLSVSEGMVRALIRAGRLPARRLGRIFLVHNDDVTRLIYRSDYTPRQKPQGKGGIA